MTTIELPDEQAAALKAKAAAEGLTLEDFFRKLAEEEAPRKLPPLLKKRPPSFSNCKSA